MIYVWLYFLVDVVYLSKKIVVYRVKEFDIKWSKYFEWYFYLCLLFEIYICCFFELKGRF